MTITLSVEPNFISPYVFACMVTLAEKQLPYTVQVLDSSKGETREPAYVRHTVTGRVPTLDHDGFALGESTAIIEYLDEQFPERPVLPRSVRERARCRQLMSWMRSDDTAAIREERPTSTMFYARSTAPLSEAALKAAAKLFTVAGTLITDERAHLFGAWTIADAELAFLLHRLILNRDEVPPALVAWAQSQWQRPTVVAFATYPRPTRSA